MRTGKILPLTGLAFLLINCEGENMGVDSVSEGFNQILSTENLALEHFLNPFNTEYEPDVMEVFVPVIDGGTYEFPGGSRLEVPAFSFVDQFGERVNGEVKISVTEFNSFGAIIASGISMKYDSLGVAYDFQSAGMFHITGEQEGEPIYIAPDKSLTFYSATDIPDDTECYNFYTMNEDNEWEYQLTDKAIENPNYTSSVPLKKPKPTEKEDLIISVKLKTGNDDATSTLWKYDGFRKDTLSSDVYNSMDSYNTLVEPSDRHQLAFDLVLTDKSQTTYRIPVTPVLNGKDYEKALASFNEQMEEITKNQARIEKASQRQFVRPVQLTRFGLCNWDRIFSRYPEAKEAKVLSIEGAEDYVYTTSSFYFVSKPLNALIPLMVVDNTIHFHYDSKRSCHLLMIDQDFNVKVVDYERLSVAILQTPNSEKITITPIVVAEDVKSGEELDVVINSI